MSKKKNEIKSKKMRLRKQYLQKRRNLEVSLINEYSKNIEEKFWGLAEVQQAQKLFIYHSYNNEVRTDTIIEQLLAENKEVFLPYTHFETGVMKAVQIFNKGNHLQKNQKGIPEPLYDLREKYELTNTGDLEVVVVPALLYDRAGHRIGYGGGYYDRFLQKLPGSVFKIGLNYQEFVLETLPTEEHDISVDIIITETEIFKI